MKAKRILCFILSAVLAVSFSACAANQAEPQTEAEIVAVSPNANKIGAYDAEAADYTLTIDASNRVHGISDMLYGVFFEDINFAADGGLYAEMVANRSFEFTELAKDDQMYHWRSVGEAEADVKINDTENALNPNNTNYLVLKNNSNEPAGVENTGFLEGMAIKEESYNLSLYAKALDGYTGGITVRLCAGGSVAAEGKIESLNDRWEKYSLKLDSTVASSENVTLQVLIDGGSAAVDMVSLFPENTYKNRENGMRADLGELLEELHPKFLRFPGGCVIEGFDENSAYSWKDSVGADENGQPLEFNGKYGDVAARRQGFDIWTDFSATDDEWPSYMSYGLGFYEFFLLSEDIGAVGVPVINAGLYCQGRQGEAVDTKSPEFERYVQDMLDLVEFCRGDSSTTWGKVRASLGHEKPFELKYIAVGNENEGEVYHERYSLFVEAFNKAKAENPELYKDLELIYSSGTADALSGNENYLKSFEYAKSRIKDGDVKAFAGATDSHYYKDPAWFLRHADYYDESNYRRSVSEMTDTPYGGAINVFLGEYASWSNNMYSALSEAAYMTGLERNGDIVRMASYAPLFSSVTARHWAPNLIWFNNASVQPSVNYYVQKLFSNNAGSELLKSELDGAYIGDKPVHGCVGIGTWLTSAEFDNITVTDNGSGETLFSEDFSDKAGFKQWQFPSDATLKVKGGRLVQTASKEEKDIGSVAFFGDSEWSNYTFELDAKKTEGEEGFFIPFAVKDSGNLFYWNIGGYGNTLSCLQEMKDGKKSGQLDGTVKELVIEEGRTYKLKIEVNGTEIKCYVDGELYVDFDAATPTEAEAYQVVSTDESGDIIIKLVNVTEKERTFAVKTDGVKGINGTAAVQQLSADRLTAENILGEEESSSFKTFELEGISESFNYTVPAYSVTVMRISG